MAGAGIITFLHNNNFGSTLQAYALQRTVRELGFDCVHLDYRPDRAEKIRNMLASGNNPKLIRKHRGKIMLCWLCALVTLLPLIIALVILVIRYLPALRDLTAIVTKTKALPSTRVTIMILAAGAVLTIPLLPLRSLITAAYVNGLAKE